MDAMPVFRRHLPLLLALLCFALGVVSLTQAWSRNLVEVRFGFLGGVPEGTRVLFSGENDFAAEDSLPLPADAEGDVSVFVPVGLHERIRMVPLAGSTVSLCSLEAAAGREPLSLADYRIIDRREVATASSRAGCVSVAPLPGATNPHVTLGLQPGNAWDADVLYWLALAVALFCAALGLSAWWLRGRVGRTAVDGTLPGAPARAGVSRLVPAYVAISLVFGTLYALVTPPGAVTDEYAHVTKAAKMANGAFLGETGDRYFPNVYEMYGRFNGYLDPNVRFTRLQLLNQLSAPVPCRPVTADLPRGADSYSPTLYLVPAAAYAIGCATGGDLGDFLLLARLGNLLAATGLIAFGIWATLRARWVLFVCALMPMSLYQIASVSADALHIASSLAWLGAICGMIEGRIPVRRAGWLLGPLALFLALSKPGAAWVLSAILFARPAYVRQAASFAPAVLKFMAIPFAIHIAWVLYGASSATPLAGVDPGANLTRIIGSPLEVAGLFFSTFMSTYGLWILKSMLAALGWLDVSLTKASYLGLLFCLAAALVMGRPVPRPPVATMAAGWIFAAGAVVMLSFPLYLFWTSPESTIIMGLQGRYFIPCLAFALCFSAGPLRAGRYAAAIHRGLAVLVPAIVMIALADGLLALLARYYP
ncbi:DUF2142 domain-containing protein [Luteimonas sp. Y-2-2-4F]|nr:DUF2142 domain-containing protein [Luteimonas sp. Y-2-2-4F]MCD9031671.1 DUF2142 domain-containing protein [Luteimonas sp. Y-2-2-4F]